MSGTEQARGKQAPGGEVAGGKAAHGNAAHGNAAHAKAAVPVLLFTFVFSLVVDNGFKTMTGPMAEGLGISVDTASLQASLAGVLVGVGAVFYAALADFISIRKILITAIGLVTVGSLMGFLFSGSWPLVLTGRLVQTAGLAAAETLYVIYVTKHLPENEQKKYLGFSTASFQAGLLVGALTSGYVSTYVSWRAMFLVPLALVLALPAVWNKIPEEETAGGHIDFPGLLLITAFAAGATFYFQEFALFWLVFSIASLAGFAAWVVKGRRPLVKPEFFKNKRYTWALVLVFIIYSTQLGYIFLLPFMASGVHGLGQDKAALLMIPGYFCAVLVGIFSGQIGKVMSSRTTIFTALGMIAGALALAALLLELGVWVLVISIVAFASGFALMYAPLVNTALWFIPAEKSGIAIGFYNLTINIAIPVGIAYVAKLQSSFGVDTDPTPGAFSSVLWVLVAVAATGAVVYFLADRALLRGEKRAGNPVP